jgi:hypothetical protein
MSGSRPVDVTYPTFRVCDILHPILGPFRPGRKPRELKDSGAEDNVRPR